MIETGIQRRPQSETDAIVKRFVSSQAEHHLDDDDLELLMSRGTVAAESVDRDGLWRDLLGFEPAGEDYVEYEAREERCDPAARRVWCRILASRRADEDVIAVVVWHPDAA